MPHWSNLVKCLTPSDFYSSFQRFSALYKPQFIKYVEKFWIPLAPWLYNAWTEKLPHFDHQTTSRIESSHAYIKTHLLNSQAGFPEAIKLITLALKAQHHKIKSQFHQQKITSLQNINSIFASCHGKISNYALRISQKNFQSINPDRNGRCNQAQTVRTGIPCMHRISELLLSGRRVEPSDFHRQWHLKVSIVLFLFVFLLNSYSRTHSDFFILVLCRI